MAKIDQIQVGVTTGQEAADRLNEALKSVDVGVGVTGSGTQADPLKSNIAAEINAATEKNTPVNADKVPITDSEDTNKLKWLSWANIKATLKTYFDTIYSTFSGSYTDLTDKPDFSPYAEKANVLELDNTNAFTPDADYEPATKKYVDDNSGGGGNLSRHVTTPTPVTDTLNIDWNGNQEAYVAASASGGIELTQDVTTVNYLNTTNKQALYLFVNMATTISITLGSGIISGDSRLSGTILTLESGVYMLRITYDNPAGIGYLEVIPLEASSGGGGGHQYLENDTIQTQRAKRNLKHNGSKAVFVDDAANDETEESVLFEVALDVDPSGKNDADIWQYNAASGKTEPAPTKFDDRFLTNVEIATDNGLLSTIFPAGYKLTSLIVEPLSGDATQLVDIGYPDGLDQTIVASQNFDVGVEKLATLVTVGGIFASSSNDFSIGIDSDSSTAFEIQLTFKFEKII